MKKLSIILFMLAVLISIAGTNSSYAAAVPFSYDVGQTFIVEGYTFKMVNKDKRIAMATVNVDVTSWGAADSIGRTFGQNIDYVLASRLLSYSDYNNYNTLVNLAGLWLAEPDWYRFGAYYITSSGGLMNNGGDVTYSLGVRPVLTLKSGLYIDGTTLIEMQDTPVTDVQYFPTGTTPPGTNITGNIYYDQGLKYLAKFYNLPTSIGNLNIQ